MSPKPTKTPPPAGLDVSGARLWGEVVEDYELRIDELRLLEQAARTLDLIDRIGAELDGVPLMVPGSTGQARPHPMLTEIRGHRVVFGSLLKQLGLPDESAASKSERARKAASARWSRGA